MSKTRLPQLRGGRINSATTMKLVLMLVNCLLIIGVAISYQRSLDFISKKFYWFVFLVKWLAAMSLGLAYVYVYPSGDTWNYFEEARKLSLLARSDFSSYCSVLFTTNDTSTVTHFLYLHDRSFLFVKIVSSLSLLSGDNYWIIASYFSLISFCSSWLLVKQLKEHVADSQPAALLAVFFVPSILFWTSGLLKETLGLASVYFLTSILIKVLRFSKVGIAQWILSILALWLGWLLKYYWMGFFICAWITSWLVSRTARNRDVNPITLTLGWLSLFIFFAVLASFAHPNFHVEHVMNVIVANHNQSIARSAPGNYIEFYRLQPTLISLVSNSPWAFVSGLFRPLPFETTSILSTLASLENVGLFVLAFSFLFYARRTSCNFTLPILVFATVLCIFLALSTPNFGTLSRYRVGFLPFLVFVLAHRNPLLNYFEIRFPFFIK